MKKSIYLFLPLLLAFSACQGQILKDLKDAADKGREAMGGNSSGSALSNEEIVDGLKTALKVGADSAVAITSANNGFYKNELIYIPFPEEAQKAKEYALKMGLDNQVEKFEMTMNRAAEEAAKEAAPIFVDAITSMTVRDGYDILKGEDDAATNYLKNTTTAELTEKFRPVVERAIEKVELTKYWNPIVTKYNATTMFSGNEKVDPDLTAYITQRAIEGLFVYIEKEEKNIRDNPQARVTEILQKVFGS